MTTMKQMTVSSACNHLHHLTCCDLLIPLSLASIGAIKLYHVDCKTHNRSSRLQLLHRPLVAPYLGTSPV